MDKATFCLVKSQLIPHDGYPGYYTYPYNGGRLSIQPDGTLATRPNDSEIGPWEQGQLLDNKLVWTSSSYPTGAYAMLVADV